jgi:hypothetical protein
MLDYASLIFQRDFPCIDLDRHMLECIFHDAWLKLKYEKGYYNTGRYSDVWLHRKTDDQIRSMIRKFEAAPARTV